MGFGTSGLAKAVWWALTPTGDIYPEDLTLNDDIS